jgi:hypothetical protein
LRPFAHCSRSQPRPSARTRYRSAIPAPRRLFRKIPSWRRRRCTGGITAIIIIIVTIIVTIIIIIVGTAGIIATITIITAITTVTGTAGKRGSLTHGQARFAVGLFSSWPPP